VVPQKPKEFLSAFLFLYQIQINNSADHKKLFKDLEVLTDKGETDKTKHRNDTCFA